MKIVEKKGSLILMHSKKEKMSWKKCYELCLAKVEELKNDKGIEHIRYIVDMLSKKVKAHDKRIALYSDMARLIERDGVENDDTLLLESNYE